MRHARHILSFGRTYFVGPGDRPGGRRGDAGDWLDLAGFSGGGQGRFDAGLRSRGAGVFAPAVLRGSAAGLRVAGDGCRSTGAPGSAGTAGGQHLHAVCCEHDDCGGNRSAAHESAATRSQTGGAGAGTLGGRVRRGGAKAHRRAAGLAPGYSGDRGGHVHAPEPPGRGGGAEPRDAGRCAAADPVCHPGGGGGAKAARGAPGGGYCRTGVGDRRS